MKVKQNILIGFVLISFCAISFYIAFKINNSKKVNETREHYKNKVCVEINNIINLISSIDELNIDDENIAATTIHSSEFLAEASCNNDNMEEITVVTRDERDMELLNNISQSFNLLCNCFDDDVFSSTHLTCKDFLNDGIISKNEIVLINSFKEDLQNVLKKLSNEEISIDTNSISTIHSSEVLLN